MARTKKVNVRYTGAGKGIVRRVVGDYVWDRSNDYQCAVAEKDVETLLQSGDFAVEQEPDSPATDKEEQEGEQ